MTYGLRGASGHHRRLPSHATSATTLNGIPSGLVTFETWGLGAADLTDHDPVETHGQYHLHQRPHRYLATAIETGRSRLVVRRVGAQRDVELAYFFDATDAVAGWRGVDERREQRRLSGSGGPETNIEALACMTAHRKAPA